ncbi:MULTISPECIES: hypothetical protein [Pseudomonas syringae group]|uniref:hypothetical protein n=1 Tax=Pseudomonas syringae group TaxID=136849 RepID=UPI000730A7BF|nr:MULTISPECIES: hypothetical protein [Pseudomonas syringae group]KTC02134.1 hypothetical protein AO386_13295 [Pseudomonas syringae ICMP 11292]
MHRVLLATVIVVSIAGCSSKPVDSDSAKRVPADRTFAYQSIVPSGATLIISQDNGFWASGGCFLTVLIDGNKAAKVNTCEMAKFHLKPGRHILGIAGDEDGSGLCAMQIGQPAKESATELNVGEVQKLRSLEA